MRDVLRWDPFRELEGAAGGDYGLFAPSFDVKENKEGYVFRADLPGVKEEDLEISLTGNRLAISGKREQEKHEQGDTYYASERSYGSFSRAFTLPDGTDAENVKAELKKACCRSSSRRNRKYSRARSRSARTRAARRRPDARAPRRVGSRLSESRSLNRAHGPDLPPRCAAATAFPRPLPRRSVGPYRRGTR